METKCRAIQFSQSHEFPVELRLVSPFLCKPFVSDSAYEFRNEARSMGEFCSMDHVDFLMQLSIIRTDKFVDSFTFTKNKNKLTGWMHEFHFEDVHKIHGS